MKRFLATGICLLPMIFLGVTSTFAQETKTMTENSFQRAREILELGMQALGGLKGFQAIDDITFSYSAQVTELGQSARPDGTDYIRPLEGNGIIDLRGKRNYRLSRTHYLGSADFVTTVTTTETSGFTADLTSNAVFPLAKPAVDNNNKASLRTFPHQLIQLALNRMSTLRWLGEQEVDRKKQEVLTFADSDGTQIALYFDAHTNLLTKQETLGDRITEGLGSSETIFADYHLLHNVQIPSRVITSFRGQRIQNLSYTNVEFNTHPNDALFDRPNGAAVGPEVGGSPQPLTITNLAPNIYYVNGVETGGIFFYSSMFVVLKDYVFVIEAPVGDGLSRAIMAKIQETAPGKPIKYLALTHYHIDHVAGVRAYLAAGSTVVTTPGNKDFIEKLALLPHPLSSNGASRSQPAPSIETFRGKRVFGEGENAVELYDLGPTPHVDEMVIAYLPREKLAFVSDLFPVNFKGTTRRGDPTSIFLYQKFRELGLDVERIASGHGRIGSIEELRQAALSVAAGTAERATSDNRERRQ